jgi:hypothetical protein
VLVRGARVAAIFAGLGCAVVACLFPSLDDLGGGDAGTDAVATIDATNDSAADAPTNDVQPIIEAGDGGCPASEPNLVGYWKLDEGTGITAHDCSGNGRDGTFVGGQASWTTGRNDAGAAILVDPATSVGCISVGTFPALTGALTLALWTSVVAFPPDGGNKQYFASKAFTFSQGGYRFASANNPPDEYDFGVDILDAGSSEILAAAYPTGTWVHLAVTYNPGVDMTLYVNGVLVTHKTGNVPGAIVDDPKAAFRIGCRADSSDYISASIAEVRAYDRVLSQTEITTIYNQ